MFSYSSMDQKKWFILSNQRVTGPYTEQELTQSLSSWQNPLIWGRGQTEWVNHEKWQKYLKEHTDLVAKAKLQSERQWRVRVAGTEVKPMTHDQMIDYLRNRTDLSDIMIWTEGYSEWKEIYQIHKVMDDLGVSRRAHPRVPIMGTIVCEGASNNFETKIQSISEGGLGIIEAPQVKIGEKFKIIIKSQNLFAPINATAEVVYTGSDGYAGMKFVSIHSESKSAIIEYVKKFADARPSG